MHTPWLIEMMEEYQLIVAKSQFRKKEESYGPG